MRTVLLIGLFFTLNSHSQLDTNVEDVFKMHLFLDKTNVNRSDLDKSIIKNDSLFNSFKKKCSLNIDTLKQKSNILLSIDGYFTFYSINSVNYSDSLNNTELWLFKIDLSNEFKYILAINNNTGRSYRLSGFRSNDFFSFYLDIKNAFRDSNFKELKKEYFFREYIVENIDFKCLYKGLRQNKIDKEKYPCLKNCSDTFSLHQSEIK